MTEVDLAACTQQLRTCLEDLQQVARLASGKLLLVGASSSEVVGKRIGSATSLEVGRAIAAEVLRFAAATGVAVAFQCCEHLNRALVVDAGLARARGWQELSAIPVPGAGGSVAASAWAQLANPCLVDSVRADAGIDIGDTFIGMHLKAVVVPVRGSLREIGQAHVTMATTRPPLIGGKRAIYDVDVFRERMGEGKQE